MTTGLMYAILGMVLAVGLGGIGSAIGLSYTCSATAGVIAEDPKKFGRCLPLLALPSSQGLYGFVIAIMANGTINALASAPGGMTVEGGLAVLAACLPVAITGIFTGIYQGRVATAGIHTVAKRPDQSIKGLIMASMVEFYAILGLLISIFALGAVA